MDATAKNIIHSENRRLIPHATVKESVQKRNVTRIDVDGLELSLNLLKNA